MSRSIRFTKLGIDVRSAFCWDKQTIIEFATSLSENPNYGTSKDRIPHIKRAADLLKAPSPTFMASSDGRKGPEPIMFPYHNQELPFTSIHDVLGYIMTNAVEPVFMTVLQPGRNQAPFSGHVAYSALPAKEVFFSTSPLHAVSFSASLPFAGLPKAQFKAPAQLLRFRQMEERFGDIEKQVREHNPPEKIDGSGTQIALTGPNRQRFGNCAETLSWIAMSGMGRGGVMGGVTLMTQDIARLQSYDESVIEASRMPLCENCQFWLKHLIKGKSENFEA